MKESGFHAIRPSLKHVKLKPHAILHESNRRTGGIYFPDSGLISLVIVTSDGRTAEAGVVGREGVVGIEALVGLKRSPLREIVQIGGTAHRISGPSIQGILGQFPEILFQLSRFAVVNRMQISQTAVIGYMKLRSG